MRELKKRKGTASVFRNESNRDFFGVQAKLNIGQPGDKYEKEADKTADQVVNKTADRPEIRKKGKDEEEVQQKPLAENISSVQKQELEQEEKPVQKQEAPEEEEVQAKCADCKKEGAVQKQAETEDEEPVQKQEEEDEKQVQTKKTNTSRDRQNTRNLENKLSGTRGTGHQMDAATLQEMEAGFGVDFSQVNIHTDQQAVEMNQALGAQAFTHGRDIYFNQGKYNPKSAEGKHLLTHELTHVIQQNKNKQADVFRAAEETPSKKATGTPALMTRGWKHHNTRAYANCEGVQVQGFTDANYSHSFRASGTPQRAESCTDCSGDDCITVTGTLISVFTANPQITLPAVPGGLSECEHMAVQNFINTTLRRHEEEHVTAFNTYNATVRTPFQYTGCADGLEAHLQQIHDNIEQARRASADALSAALDPFNARIPCDCPEQDSP